MAKQLVSLWSFVLLLAPAPAVGDYNSNCTVGDSPGKAMQLYNNYVRCSYYKVCRVTFYAA